MRFCCGSRWGWCMLFINFFESLVAPCLVYNTAMSPPLCQISPHRCNVSPLRGEKPQNRPLSKLNTGRFALCAMLPVINTEGTHKTLSMQFGPCNQQQTALYICFQHVTYESKPIYTSVSCTTQLLTSNSTLFKISGHHCSCGSI